MKEQLNPVSTLVFRRLLFELHDREPNTCVRFRLLGEMWKPHFLRVHSITEKGAIFIDEQKEFVFVSDLAEVVQFEIDFRFHDFQPHFHYEVKPVSA